MPKLKSNKSAAKRFKRSASGTFRHGQSHRSHILTKKDTKRKRHLRPMATIDKADHKLIERMLPYA